MNKSACISNECFCWHDTGNEAFVFMREESIQSDAADEPALVGKGSYESGLLSAGGVITAVEAAENEKCDNTYSLSSPLGYYIESDMGMGFVYLIID